MSKDLTPKELDFIQQQSNLPNIVDNLMIHIGNKIESAFTDEQKEMSHKYPKLGRFGFDMLNACKNNGVYSNEKGKELLQKIEDYFNGINLEDKELANNIQKWYEGTFCPGYYMEDNNTEFANYLKQKILSKNF